MHSVFGCVSMCGACSLRRGDLRYVSPSMGQLRDELGTGTSEQLGMGDTCFRTSSSLTMLRRPRLGVVDRTTGGPAAASWASRAWAASSSGSSSWSAPSPAHRRIGAVRRSGLRRRHLHLHHARVWRHLGHLLHRGHQHRERRLLWSKRGDRHDRLSGIDHRQHRRPALRRHPGHLHLEQPGLHDPTSGSGPPRSTSSPVPSPTTRPPRRSPGPGTAAPTPSATQPTPEPTGERRRIGDADHHRLQHHPDLHRSGHGGHLGEVHRRLHQHLHRRMRERDPRLGTDPVPQLDRPHIGHRPRRRPGHVRHVDPSSPACTTTTSGSGTTEEYILECALSFAPPRLTWERATRSPSPPPPMVWPAPPREP